MKNTPLRDHLVGLNLGIGALLTQAFDAAGAAELHRPIVAEGLRRLWFLLTRTQGWLQAAIEKLGCEANE